MVRWRCRCESKTPRRCPSYALATGWMVPAANRGGATGEAAETSAVTVARHARVLAVPGRAGEEQPSGPLGGGSQASGAGSVLVVAVPTRIASIIAGAAARARLSVVLNSR